MATLIVTFAIAAVAATTIARNTILNPPEKVSLLIHRGTAISQVVVVVTAISFVGSAVARSGAVSGLVLGVAVAVAMPVGVGVVVTASFVNTAMRLRFSRSVALARLVSLRFARSLVRVGMGLGRGLVARLSLLLAVSSLGPAGHYRHPLAQ